MKYLLLAAIPLLTACEVQFKAQDADRKLMREIFMECLDKAAKQPNSTYYNDGSEIVEQCRKTSYFLAGGN